MLVSTLTPPASVPSTAKPGTIVQFCDNFYMLTTGHRDGVDRWISLITGNNYDGTLNLRTPELPRFIIAGYSATSFGWEGIPKLSSGTCFLDQGVPHLALDWEGNLDLTTGIITYITRGERNILVKGKLSLAPIP